MLTAQPDYCGTCNTAKSCTEHSIIIWNMQSKTLVISMKLFLHSYWKLYNIQYFLIKVHSFVCFCSYFKLQRVWQKVWYIAVLYYTSNDQLFVQATKNILVYTLFSCILDSVQPLTVHSHQLLCVQPNYSGKRNTAKSCIEHSQNICSVVGCCGFGRFQKSILK